MSENTYFPTYFDATHWEQIYNPAFKSLEFERFKSQAGWNSFSLSPKKWIEAVGIMQDGVDLDAIVAGLELT